MNEHIRSRFNRRDNPFVFKHVSNLKSLDKFEDKGPCVMMASPGFMQSGVSRELLEKWAPDRRNGLIVTGYSVEGTMARSIINEPDEIIGLNGQKIPRRMTVDYISFSAHVDGTQNHKFIDEIKAQHIVLVHGEATNMARLRGSLQGKYSDKSDVKIHTPRNCEPLMLKFRAERLAKAIGSIADNPPKPGSTLSGLLVSKDFAYTILDPKDLAEFTGLSTSTIIQRQRVALNVSWEMTRWHLEGMYGSIQEGVDVEGRRTMRIMGSIDIKQSGSHELLLEWVSSINNDMVADSALALLLGIDSSPASVKMTTRPHKHDHGSEEAEEDAEERHPFADPKAKSAEEYIAMKRIARAAQIATFLEAYYGNVEEITIGKASEEDVAPGEAQGETDGTEEAQDATKQEDGPVIKEEPTDGSLPEEAPAKQDGDTNGDVAMANGHAGANDTVPNKSPPSLEDLIGGTPRQALRVYLDDKVAILDLDELAVYSRSDALRKRVLHLVALADRTATSTNDAFRDEMEGADGAVEELFLGAHSIPVEPGEAGSGEGVETRESKKLKLEG
jgi:cleavage and polyadenylation specificity factor subunit 3